MGSSSSRRRRRALRDRSCCRRTYCSRRRSNLLAEGARPRQPSWATAEARACAGVVRLRPPLRGGNPPRHLRRTQGCARARWASQVTAPSPSIGQSRGIAQRVPDCRHKTNFANSGCGGRWRGASFSRTACRRLLRWLVFRHPGCVGPCPELRLFRRSVHASDEKGLTAATLAMAAQVRQWLPPFAPASGRPPAFVCSHVRACEHACAGTRVHACARGRAGRRVCNT